MWVEPNGKTWRIRDEHGGHKVTIAKGYRTKTAARLAKVQFEADALRGEALRPRGGQILLSDWLDAWQPAWEAGLKPSSAESEPARVKNHIRPLLGNMSLDDVDPLVVQRWVARLQAGERDPADPTKWKRKPLSPKTVRNVHGLLHKIMQAAVTQRLIRANPCTATTLPRRPHHEMRFMTEPEVGRLIAALLAHWRPLVLLLVATGMRWGEATALRVGDVDLLAARPSARIIRTRHELGGGRIMFTEPKTVHSRRTVTFPKRVADALLPLVAGRNRTELVFTARRGGEVRVRNFRRNWQTACAAAGLAGLRVHDIRHSHAAALISAGVSLTAIQRRLGHSTIAVTSDLYGHLLPQVDEGILVAVEAALAHVSADDLALEIEEEFAEL